MVEDDGLGSDDEKEQQLKKQQLEYEEAMKLLKSYYSKTELKAIE